MACLAYLALQGQSEPSRYRGELTGDVSRTLAKKPVRSGAIISPGTSAQGLWTRRTMAFAAANSVRSERIIGDAYSLANPARLPHGAIVLVSPQCLGSTADCRYGRNFPARTCPNLAHTKKGIASAIPQRPQAKM